MQYFKQKKKRVLSLLPNMTTDQTLSHTLIDIYGWSIMLNVQKKSHILPCSNTKAMPFDKY